MLRDRPATRCTSRGTRGARAPRRVRVAAVEAVAQSSRAPSPTAPPRPHDAAGRHRAELARVRATDPTQVAHELAPPTARRAARGRSRAARRPDAGLSALRGRIRGYWDRCLAPWWPRIRAALEDDITHRARRVTAGGAIEVFADLDPGVRWRDGVLEIVAARPRRPPGGPRPAARARGLPPGRRCRDDRAALAARSHLHAARHRRPVGPGRRDRARSARRAARRRRADVLTALGTLTATTELAVRLGASAAGTSAHLKVLARAGLVRARRDGGVCLSAQPGGRRAAGQPGTPVDHQVEPSSGCSSARPSVVQPSRS